MKKEIVIRIQIEIPEDPIEENSQDIEEVISNERCRNVLRRASVKTVGEFLKLRNSDLRNLRGAGPKTIDKLKIIQEGLRPSIPVKNIF